MTEVAVDHVASFVAALPFPLDDFQLRACRALADGHSVLVCAPTGAGKTIVGEFAVHLALATGGKCFYTAPIKALSNQKYADLVKRYGADQVGLLTGDLNVNSNAPVVVMTTEVLRNMLYATSSTLDGLSHVVMDEVHYLADRFRGAVWEEVMLHLADSVRLANLSATVSNAEEFGAWIETIRGDTTVIVDEHRPVPLSQHVLVGARLFDLFEPTPGARRDHIVNDELVRHVRQKMHSVDDDRWSRDSRGRNGRGGRAGRPGARDDLTVSRADMIARLNREGLLPAIGFIFSRAGCDAAAQQCIRSRLNLIEPEQLSRIDEVVARHTSDLPESDLEVLGFWRWREGIRKGIASHHAGLLPAYRHAVEELFVNGLLKVVFATETLALGINMPARTVILERLVKFNGESHVDLTPGEYTQLTGRAGRRGIDIEGHAVVVWQPDLQLPSLAGLASTRTYPLRSSFRAGYNMTINLLSHMTADQSRGLLERSFAQFQADKSVVGLVRGIDRNEAQLAELSKQFGGAEAPFLSYLDLREQIRSREKTLRRTHQSDRKNAVGDSLTSLRRGDVIALRARRRFLLAVVVEPARDGGSPRPEVISEDRGYGRLRAVDFTEPVVSLGTIRLPRQLDARSARTRREVALALRSSGINAKRAPRVRAAAADDRELVSLRKQLSRHPEHKRTDRDERLALGEQYNRLLRDTNGMREKVSAATNSLSRGFDQIVALLRERGYLAEDKVTESGRMLAQVYSESDLLIAECIRREAWADLGPEELAAVASIVVYEARRDDAPPNVDGLPTEVRAAVEATMQTWDELATDEHRLRLPVTREPDTGIARGILRWAQRAPLSDALAECGDRGVPMPAGDFVRWNRQIIDPLGQLERLGDDPQLRGNAARAIKRLRHGVVEASN